MASEKILEQKKQAVAELSEKIKNSCAGVLVSYKGITVADDTKLRADLRKANVEYKVVKNSLLSRASADAGLEGVDEFLSGTTAIALSENDYVAAAKILSQFAETSKTFEVKSGFIDGKLVSLDEVKALAKLPSREVLIATVLGTMNAPIAAFARAIQAIADKKGEEQPA